LKHLVVCCGFSCVVIPIPKVSSDESYLLFVIELENKQMKLHCKSEIIEIKKIIFIIVYIWRQVPSDT